MGLDRLAQAGLDQLAEHLAPHLLAEGPLEHGPWHATGAEAAQPRLAPDRREGALQLRLHVRRGDLHLEALADRGQVLERDVRRLHHDSGDQLWLAAQQFRNSGLPHIEWCFVPAQSDRHRLEHTATRERAHERTEGRAGSAAGQQQRRRLERRECDPLRLSVKDVSKFAWVGLQP